MASYRCHIFKRQIMKRFTVPKMTFKFTEGHWQWHSSLGHHYYLLVVYAHGRRKQMWIGMARSSPPLPSPPFHSPPLSSPPLPLEVGPYPALPCPTLPSPPLPCPPLLYPRPFPSPPLRSRPP